MMHVPEPHRSMFREMVLPEHLPAGRTVRPEEARVGSRVRVRSSSRELEGRLGTVIDRLGHDERSALNVLLDGGRSELFWCDELEQLEEEKSPRGSRVERAPNTSPRIRVLLVDDHTMFRRGLTRMLTAYGGMEVVGEVPNDEWALRLSLAASPDVVVTEVQTPFEKARESLRRIRSVSPQPEVIIVTMLEAPRYLRELTRMGASACLLKSASVEHLITAIRAAVLDPETSEVVPRETLNGTEENMLSSRELEVLLLAARGLSNRQMASRLHLAEATIRRHLANTYEKLGVHSRSQATSKALAERWFTTRDLTEEKGRGPDTSYAASPDARSRAR